MRSNEAPRSWIDRRDMREPPLDYAAMHRNEALQQKIRQCLIVVSFDPGETTGWSVMETRIDKLLNNDLTIGETVTDWWHGQIDCGATMGNAGDTGTTSRRDLGVSDEGEGMGAAIMEQLVGEQFARSPAVAVVLEDFILRTQSKKRDAISPVRVISRFDQLMWERRIETFRSQPSEKVAVNDDRLKRWGFYEGGHADRHARDADRHNILFLKKIRQSRARLHRAFPALAL